jgi:ASC-1-like (ASCH) protein
MIELGFEDTHFQDIKNGKKTVIGKIDAELKGIKKGDIVKLKYLGNNSNLNELIIAQIKDIKKFSDVLTMLKEMKLKTILPRSRTYKNGEKVFEETYGNKLKDAKFTAFTFDIQSISGPRIKNKKNEENSGPSIKNKKNDNDNDNDNDNGNDNDSSNNNGNDNGNYNDNNNNNNNKNKSGPRIKDKKNGDISGPQIKDKKNGDISGPRIKDKKNGDVSGPRIKDKKNGYVSGPRIKDKKNENYDLEIDEIDEINSDVFGPRIKDKKNGKVSGPRIKDKKNGNVSGPRIKDKKNGENFELYNLNELENISGPRIKNKKNSNDELNSLNNLENININSNHPPREFELNIYEPWFSLIANGQKQVEGRLFQGIFKEFKVNDTIRFINKMNGKEKSLTVKIIKLTKYPNFGDLLFHEKLHRVLPGLPSIKCGIILYDKIYKLKFNEIKECGTLAIEIALT